MSTIQSELEKKSHSCTIITRCRICDQPLTSFLSFGSLPLANGFLYPEQVEHERYYPLECGVCTSCWMVQTSYQPEPEALFHDKYPFFTGGSERMNLHFKALAETLQNIYLEGLKNPLVVEIGSNDGTFLKHFAPGVRILGVEPSLGVARRARDSGVETLQTFFDLKTASEIVKSHGKASIIYAANVFCHISSIRDTFAGIQALLHEDGILIFEDPYLPRILDKNSYDQFYDEHVFTFSLLSVKNLAGNFGLHLFDIQPLETHGGSMRYFLARNMRKALYEDLRETLHSEESYKLTSLQTYQNFARVCLESKHSLVSLLQSLKAEGKTLAGYAATSKSTTVLNFCGIGPDLLDFIADSTPEKQGKLTPGTHIPVRSPEHFRTHYPDYAVLFGWNHLEEISAKEQEFLKRGGKWIVYVPKVAIL